MSPELATLLVWGVWALSWSAASQWSDPVSKRLGWSAEWPYRLVTIAGALLLLGVYARSHQATGRLWLFGPDAQWGLFVDVILAFVFTWWARLYLGRLWSSSVTRKADHRVVDAGPYAIVRHPIYTGIIAAAAATAAQKGTIWAIAGVIAFIVGYWMKARLEERFLREQLGPDAYDSYRRRVPMLLPFGPR